MVSTSLKEWILVTSWHGVADMSRAKSYISKVAWLLILIFTTCMFCSQVYSHCKAFASSGRDPWIETTVFELQPRIPLPVVTVCNMNLASKKSLEVLGMDLDAASHLVWWFKDIYGSVEDSNKFNFWEPVKKNLSIAFENYLEEHPENRDLSLYEWMTRIGPTCETLGMYARIHYVTPQDPCKNAKTFFTQKGVCFSMEPRISNDSWEVQTSAGLENMMTLWLDQSLTDYAPLTIAEPPNHGLSLYLGFDAVQSVFNQRIALIPGYHMWISMTYEMHIPPEKPILPIFDFTIPDKPCIMDGQLQMIDTEIFSPQLCYSDCISLMLYRQCGCNWRPTFPLRAQGQFHQCDLKETDRCWRKEIPWIEVMRTCDQNCNRSSCHQQSISYTVTGTKSPANATNAAENLRLLFKLDSYDEEMIGQMSFVNIFYEKMTAKVYQYQLRTSFEQLISNVGGQLGLWAGISIITLYQALIYAVYGVTGVIRGFLRGHPKIVQQTAEPMKYANNMGSSGFVQQSTEYNTQSKEEKLPDFMIEALKKYYANNIKI